MFFLLWSNSAFSAFKNSIYQIPSYRTGAWQLWFWRKFSSFKPVCFKNFRLLNFYFAAFVFRRERQHELIGKRPCLASAVFYSLNFDVCFFFYFTRHALLKSFTLLNKTWNAGVVFVCGIFIFYKENFFSLGNERYCRRLYPRKKFCFAVLTFSCGFSFIIN